MQQLYARGDDSRDYSLVMEMQNCPIDGVMFVTGCTPGTHRMTLTGNPENMRFSLINKEGRGWKVTLKNSNREYINEQLPANLTPAEKGMAVLRLDFDQLFELEEIN